jgi:hypothetical protein
MKLLLQHKSTLCDIIENLQPFGAIATLYLLEYPYFALKGSAPGLGEKKSQQISFPLFKVVDHITRDEALVKTFRAVRSRILRPEENPTSNDRPCTF